METINKTSVWSQTFKKAKTKNTLISEVKLKVTSFLISSPIWNGYLFEWKYKKRHQIVILFQFVFAHIVWFLSYSSQIMHIIRRLIWYTVYPSFVGFSGCVLMPYNIFQKYLLEHLISPPVFSGLRVTRSLFDHLKSLYSDTKILSKYIPSLQKRL